VKLGLAIRIADSGLILDDLPEFVDKQTEKGTPKYQTRKRLIFLK
jgi:hypothetical protein